MGRPCDADGGVLKKESGEMRGMQGSVHRRLPAVELQPTCLLLHFPFFKRLDMG
jgi:hypothetical protein